MVAVAPHKIRLCVRVMRAVWRIGECLSWIVLRTLLGD